VRQDPHPINESSDAKSQIEEFLDAYNGEGIQHIALAADDIYATVASLKGRKVKFLDTPDTYYELLAKRLPGHGENVAKLRKNRILLDGAPDSKEGAKDGGCCCRSHRDRDRAHLLRDHPAQGRRGLRRGQFQGAVRIDGARPDRRGVLRA